MGSSGSDSKAEDYLRKASLAGSAGARAKYATRGLAAAGEDRTLRAMLLRQLYLSHMESGRFEQASEIARAALELGVMADVACQDLARAYLGLGLHREAIAQLRRATRMGPASRRAFHLWTLGSVMHFRGDYAGAVLAFERAVRWGTTARPLYEAQLTLSRLEAEPASLADPARRLAEVRAALEEAPCGQGYGRFVLGELAYRQGDMPAARQYLEEFLRRADSGRIALQVGLTAEIQRARQLLDTASSAPASGDGDPQPK